MRPGSHGFGPEADLPIYDYRCTACGHRFEARQGFDDDPVAQCPTCGERSERLITAVAVHFKGSGFYKTDYKSGNGRVPSNGKTAEGTTESKSGSTASAADSKSKDTAAGPVAGGSPGKSEGTASPKGKKAASKAAE
jgi:putative FmdB family regulatory protein